MNKVEQKYDEILDVAFSDAIDKILAAEEANFDDGVKNYQAVSPAAKKKLQGLLKYYAKKPHPFTACVRDNRKRFGPRAEQVCAVLKDIIRGTTKWRGHPGSDKGSAGLSEYDPIPEELMLDEETADLIERLSEQDLWGLLGIVGE